MKNNVIEQKENYLKKCSENRKLKQELNKYKQALKNAACDFTAIANCWKYPLDSGFYVFYWLNYDKYKHRSIKEIYENEYE